jgi:hypothetical protein
VIGAVVYFICLRLSPIDLDAPLPAVRRCRSARVFRERYRSIRHLESGRDEACRSEERRYSDRVAGRRQGPKEPQGGDANDAVSVPASATDLPIVRGLYVNRFAAQSV